jgi:hypothetical protein
MVMKLGVEQVEVWNSGARWGTLLRGEWMRWMRLI